MQLLDEITELDAQDLKARESACKEYAEIVGRAAKPKKTDAARLRELMKSLNLTADDVKQDAAALATVARLREHILSDDARQALVNNAEVAIKARLALEEEFMRQVRVLQTASDQAMMTRSSGEARDSSAQKEIDGLHKSRPMAFGVLPTVAAERSPDLSVRVESLGGPEYQYDRPDPRVPTFGGVWSEDASGQRVN